MIQAQFDLLLAYVARDVDDIVRAKQEYFTPTGGEVHEDDRCFESRLQAFFNWYLFDRKRDDVTPAQRFLQNRGAETSAADKEVLMGFTQTRLGLYDYRGRKGLILGPKKGQGRGRDAITRKALGLPER